MNQVFKPQDFRLLRKPCKRYPPETIPKALREVHTASPLLAGVSSHYATGGHGASIGDGCYRSLPVRGNGHN